MPAYKPVTHVIFDMDGLLLDTERLYTVAISELTEEYGKAYPWELKVQCMGMKGDASAKLIIDSLELPLTVPEYLEKIDLKYKELFPQAVLLPDTVGPHLAIHQSLLAEYGQTCTWYDLIQVMGHTALETAQEICRLKSVPVDPEIYQDKVAALQFSMFPKIGLMRAHILICDITLACCATGAERLVRHLHKHGVPIAIASGSSQTSFDLKTTSHRELMKLFNPVVLSSSDPEVKAGKPAPDVFLVCAGRFPDKPHSSKVRKKV
ncbi:hypothetical protein HAZT_HAZT010903, partial [Hyalella azteca]